MNNAQKILKLRSLLKEGIHFREENLNVDNTKSGFISNLIIEINNMSCDIDDVQLSASSRGVTTYIAGYVCTIEYHERLIGNLSDESDDHSYVQLLSRGRLMIPSLTLSDCVQCIGNN